MGEKFHLWSYFDRWGCQQHICHVLWNGRMKKSGNVIAQRKRKPNIQDQKEITDFHYANKPKKFAIKTKKWQQLRALCASSVCDSDESDGEKETRASRGEKRMPVITLTLESFLCTANSSLMAFYSTIVGKSEQKFSAQKEQTEKRMK